MSTLRLTNCLTAFMLFVAVFSTVCSAHMFCMNKVIVTSVELASMSSIAVAVSIVLDLTSFTFVSTVTLISAAVMLFSKSYMINEKFNNRFHWLVIAFVASMVILILSPNLLMVLLGWDGLGVTSYLLVIYFNSYKANNAGMLTALTNRLGDVAILIAIGVAASWGSLSHMYWSEWMTWHTAALLLVLAAMTKSAQVPFSAWLPAAMAAPTPVSSLVHSSTLVTAGVYLLVRFYPALVYSELLLFLLSIGVLTMFMASVSAMFETDMKKVVALSTLSQLGMMFCALGTGNVSLAMLHLLAHAFFKALLFISVGQVIHLSSDYQDLRMISPNTGPISTISMALIANLSLMGVPFLSGFFSKDAILEMASISEFWVGIYFLLLLSVCATALYSIRFILLALTSGLNSQPVSATLDSDTPMFNSMTILWPLAVLGGSALLWEMSSRPAVFALPTELKMAALSMLTAGSMAAMLQSHSFVAAKMGWTWGSMWSLPFSSQICNTDTLFYSSGWRKLDQSWVYTAVEPVKDMSVYSTMDSDWAKLSSLMVALAGVSLLLLWYLCV